MLQLVLVFKEQGLGLSSTEVLKGDKIQYLDVQIVFDPASTCWQYKARSAKAA